MQAFKTPANMKLPKVYIAFKIEVFGSPEKWGAQNGMMNMIERRKKPMERTSRGLPEGTKRHIKQKGGSTKLDRQKR